MTKNFVKYVGKDNLNGFASWGFTSGLLFQQAADAVVKKNGKNGLTRANLLAELANIHDFNASGMVGTTDIGNKTRLGLLHARPVQEREVRARLPDQEGHVRLQQVERATRSRKT